MLFLYNWLKKNDCNVSDMYFRLCVILTVGKIIKTLCIQVSEEYLSQLIPLCRQIIETVGTFSHKSSVHQRKMHSIQSELQYCAKGRCEKMPQTKNAFKNFKD